MHRPEEDVLARTEAERMLADLIDDGEVHEFTSKAAAEAKGILDAFPAVQYDTTVSKARGTEVKLRRLVITGPWEVDITA